MVAKSSLGSRISAVLAAFELDPATPLSGSTSLAGLALWAERVTEWNRRIDLTAARSEDELADLLVADAAAIARACRQTAHEQTWIDVGSGAGAPGLALALVVPSLQITLVEPSAKRVAFLRSVVGELGAGERIRVERRRSDALAPRGFDVAVSRATLAPPDWLAEGGRLATRGVWVLLAQAETPAVPNLRLVEQLEYRWPLTGVERRALRYEPLELPENLEDPG